MLNRIFHSNHKGFTPYINFQRPRRFCAKHTGSCITGFTLIEAVVAVFVLIIGVLAAFNVAQTITVYSRVTSSRLTAAYLAQEGIELVRNQRDSNWLTGGMDWEANKADLIGSFVGTEPDLLEKFDRTINISDENDKIEISVEVVWEEKGVAQPSVIAQTELYNWYGQ